MPMMKRKYAAKRKLIRRRRFARPLRRRPLRSGFGRSGGFVLKRRVDLTSIYNNNTVTAGTVGIKQGSASSSTWLSTGTPVLSAGAVAGSPFTALYDIPFSMNFKLADITSYTDITSIADKYKFGLVSIKVLNNGQSPTYGGGMPAPFIEYVYDHDDATVPTIDQVTQKMGLRTKNFGLSGKCNIHVRPLPLIGVGSGGSTLTSMTPRSAPWLDAADTGVNHYGIKGVIRNFACSSTASVMSALSFDPVYTIIAKDLQ